jgi:Glycosyl hydrolases family 28
MSKPARTVCQFALVCLVSLTGAAVKPTTFDIRDYGAQSDTQRPQTTSIQQTIDACAQSGGGTVVIPPGTFQSGAIRLRSHVIFRLESGAVLKGSPILDDYRIDGKLVGLLSCVDSEDVGICGTGTIDGNSMAFMQSDKPHLGNDYDRKFIRQGDSYMTSADSAADGPILPKPRPGVMVSFQNCKKVRVSDVTLREPPYWTFHINGSDDVVIRGLTIANRQDIPNNDGIHCSTSRDVHISDCSITTGDDAIAVTGINDHGPAVPGFIGYDKPCEDVTITNCTLRSRSAGIRIGYGANDMRNIVASNLVIDANRGIALFTRNPGSIRNVLVENVIIRTQLYRGHWWGKAEPIHISAIAMANDQTVGQISDVRFHNVLAEAEDGVVIYGGEAGLVHDIEFDGFKLTMNGSPRQADYGGNFDLRPALEPSLRLFKHDIPAIFAHQVKALTLRNVQVGWAGQIPDFFSKAVECEDFDGVAIDGFRGTSADKSDAILLRRGQAASVNGATFPVR